MADELLQRQREIQQLMLMKKQLNRTAKAATAAAAAAAAAATAPPSEDVPARPASGPSLDAAPVRAARPPLDDGFGRAAAGVGAPPAATVPTPTAQRPPLYTTMPRAAHPLQQLADRLRECVVCNNFEGLRAVLDLGGADWTTPNSVSIPTRAHLCTPSFSPAVLFLQHRVVTQR
jgi:hypothetical protein